MALPLNRTCAFSKIILRGFVVKRTSPVPKINSFSTSSSGEVTEETTKTQTTEELLEQNNKLSAQVKELQDKFQRALADGENKRRGYEEQLENAKIYSIQGFCKDLIEVADILSKAVESVPEETLKNSNDTLLSSFVEGVKMTESNLQRVLRKHGVEKIIPQSGEKFDANFHSSQFFQPLPTLEQCAGRAMPASGTVSVVTKVGYKLHNRAIRAAVVGLYS